MIDLVMPSVTNMVLASTAVEKLVEDGDLGSDETAGPWVFQGVDDMRPQRDPKGTGTSAVVLMMPGTWGSNNHNTAQFPVIQLVVWSDLSRSPDGTPLARDAFHRSLRVYQAIHPLLHDPANVHHDWPGGVRIISSLASGSADVGPVMGEDGMYRLVQRYEQTLG